MIMELNEEKVRENSSLIRHGHQITSFGRVHRSDENDQSELNFFHIITHQQAQLVCG